MGCHDTCGDIISIIEVFSTKGYHGVTKDFSPHTTEHPHGTHDISHIYHDISHDTEHPHSTHDIPKGSEHPHSTEHPMVLHTHYRV